MGECVKYKGRETKIGTCEHLYFVTYPKFKQAMAQGLVSPSENSVHPASCLKPDSGFLFRFPFPDEDKLAFGDIGNNRFDRGISIIIRPDADKDLLELTDRSTLETSTIRLVYQKLVHRASDGALILAPVFRNPDAGQVFRIEDKASVVKIIRQMIRHQVQNEPDEEKRNLYREIALRMLKGFNLNPELSIGKPLLDNRNMPKKIKVKTKSNNFKKSRGI